MAQNQNAVLDDDSILIVTGTLVYGQEMEADTLEIILGGISTTEGEAGKETESKEKVIVLCCTVKKSKIRKKQIKARNTVKRSTIKRPTGKSDTNEFDMLVDEYLDVQMTVNDVVSMVNGEDDAVSERQEEDDFMGSGVNTGVDTSVDTRVDTGVDIVSKVQNQ